MNSKFFALLIVTLLLLVGCQDPPVSTAPEVLPPEQQQNEPRETQENETGTENEQWLDFQPNELGQVMVLMYHEIGGEEATWRRTVENFRADLELLYQENYRPVNLNDFIKGEFHIPAGTTPFVLTFDDGSSGHYRIIEKNGEYILDPDCAVAILLDMAEQYPDFTPAGTFFIYYPVPFRQSKLIGEKLAQLTAWGFEIGNHAYHHENLSKISAQAVQQALAKNVAATQNYLPGYQVTSLALPYGARPQDDTYLLNGVWENTSYQNSAVLLVGANPAPSPFALEFDPYRLPRVRADGTELPRWLNYFRKQPQKRFISDGDPAFVTVPEALAPQVKEESLQDKQLRTYMPKDYAN